VIPAIPSIPSIGSAESAGATQAASGASSATGASGASGATAPTSADATSASSSTDPSFNDLLGNAIDSLNTSQQSATNLSLQAAAGNANIADVTVASTEADLETQLVTSVRDKAVDAFNSIMDMQA
jgi:flagellar hook-basal body complex protein FliE